MAEESRTGSRRYGVSLLVTILLIIAALCALTCIWMGSMGMDIHWTAWIHSRSNDPATLRFLIESSPNNLDLRQGTDAQSERIGGLIYDALVKKDTHFVLQPWLATSWERPDPLTWIFHIRANVRFHDGKPLTAADVAWSIKSMVDGTVISPKGGNLGTLVSVVATGPLTVTVKTAQSDDSLLFNLSDGLFGVVEHGAGRDEGLHPVGTGPFEFVSQMQDRDVILQRNPNHWAGAPHIARIRFEVIPDTITAALEMRKGSADIESNVLTPDMVQALRREKNVVVQSGPGAIVMYANFNTQDPKLRDPRVRQAIAYSIDRPALIASLWHGEAQLADTLLPSSHWAAASDAELPQYPHDIARAIALLDAAGLKPDKDGIRLRFTLKTSTDETTRLIAQAMQQQMHAAGIALELRSAEFGTFYSDITRGAFQMYMLRWIGSNEDPDFLRYAFATSSFPPKGGNRGRYSNPRVDALLAQANAETGEAARRRDYVEVQQILGRDLPSIPLWYPNNEVVHSTRLVGVHLDPGGTFDFLRTAQLR
jgi:peptide/nickel transport system substrate-binding protein